MDTPVAPPVVAVGPVTVRLAAPDELDAAGAVVSRAYQADGQAHGSYLDLLSDARGRSRDAEIAVAVSPDGAVLGSVTLVRPPSRWVELAGPDEAEIRMLGVDPAAHRQGLGRGLTLWCLQRAAGLGAHRVLLCSLGSMTPAHTLYTSLGFARRPGLDATLDDGRTLLAFGLELDGVR